MKAPDKIYFEIDDKGKVHTYFGLQPDNAIEYIRKDALLEWLEHAKTVYNIRGANTFELLTLQMVIEYINSM